MKKLIAIGLFIFSNMMAYAQSTPPQSPSSNPQYSNPPRGRTTKFKGGLMVSPSVTWLDANVDNSSINKISSPNPHLGFSYGLVGDFFFNNNYGIGTGIRVTGFDESFDYYNNAHNAYYIGRTLHLQYLDIPITLKMRTNDVGYMKYFAQFGFMPSVKLSARADLDTSGVTNANNLNVSSSVNILVLYSVVGIGAEYNLGGTTNLVFGITWYNGFTNIWNKAGNRTSADPNINSNFNTPAENIALNFGVLF